MGMNEIEPKGQAPVWPATPAEGGLILGQAPTGYVETAPSDLSLKTLYRIILDWRWFILGAGAAGLVGAVILTLLATPMYQSSATIELNPPRVEVMDVTKGGGSFDRMDPSFLATQIGLLQSRSLAERVVQDLNLASNETLAPPQLNRAARERYLAG